PGPALVDELSWRQARRTLDQAELERLAHEAVPRIAGQAAALASSFRASPLSKELQAAIERARPGHGVRSLEEIATVLAEADPLERAEALWEAAEQPSPEAAALVLGEVQSRYMNVRLAAVDALRSIA